MSARKMQAGGRNAAGVSNGDAVKEPDDGFFEEIEHTADLALKCGGTDLASFFRSAALGTYRLMGVVKAPGVSREETTVALDAPDIESLLVDWLSELTYLAEAQNRVFEEIRFEILTGTQLQARLGGGEIQRLETAIKAVTYHHLEVAKTSEGYSATVVFDV